MKLYQGYREEDSVGTEEVWVSENGFDKPLDPGPSLKVKIHSPDGFNWGYRGSGPSQLALALLLDVTGDEYNSETFYQEFKDEFVSRWGDTWEANEDQIKFWFEEKKKGLN
jgi:hypothetical protein